MSADSIGVIGAGIVGLAVARRITERFPGVQRATGRLRWTGSWYTAFATVDRMGGADVDPDFVARVERFLDSRRMAGVDVDVARPVPIAVGRSISLFARRDCEGYEGKDHFLLELRQGQRHGPA